MWKINVQKRRFFREDRRVYLDPSLRPSIKRLAKSGTEIKDPVTKKNFFKTIRVLALQRQKAQKETKTEG